jgi:hypothetical protein
LQDGIEQPFEEFLPYDRFAVRVQETDLYKLPQMLDILFRDSYRLSRMRVTIMMITIM